MEYALDTNNVQRSLQSIIFVTVVCTILVCLGFWQLYRLGVKNEIIHQMQLDLAQAATPFHRDMPEYAYKHHSKYSINGQFLYGKDMFLYGTHPTQSGKHGYFILTPFTTEDGIDVVVNRGWISPTMIEQFVKHQHAKYNTPDPRHIVAILVKPSECPECTQHTHNNDRNRNIWFYVDLPAMSKFTERDLRQDFYMTLLEGEPFSRELFIATADHFLAIPNDHLWYAITWFSLAIALVVIYIMYNRQED